MQNFIRTASTSNGAIQDAIDTINAATGTITAMIYAGSVIIITYTTP